MILVMIGSILIFLCFFLEIKIENLVFVGFGNGLVKLLELLNKQNNKYNFSEINENKIKENDLFSIQ